LSGTVVGRRRIYENPAARTRAYRARRRLRLEAKAFATLPLNLVRADPLAAVAVLVGELGSEAISRLRQALDAVLTQQALTLFAQQELAKHLAQQAIAEQELVQQDTRPAGYPEMVRESGAIDNDGNSDQSEADHD
jgi:hypothetical protein